MLKNPKVWLGNCAEFTDRDQIAVEREIEQQMEEGCYRRGMEFSDYLDLNTKCPWRLHIVDAGDKVRLPVIIPGYTPKDTIVQMILSGRFDKYVPDWVEEWYWWIEKW